MKKKKHEVAVVKDGQTGKYVTITEDFKRDAIEEIEGLKNACRKDIEARLEIGMRLKRIRDEQYYRVDYDTFEQFIEAEIHMSRRYAYNHIELVEKLPQQFVQLIAQIPLTMYKLTQLLPLPEKTLEKVDEKQLKEWAEMPLKDFNEEMRQTKARYQKMRRSNIRQQEKIKSLAAEKEDLIKEIEELGKEMFILKAGEKNEKIIRLQQDRENLLDKIRALEGKVGEYEQTAYSEEQALAIIQNSFDQVLSSFWEVRKIKVLPAICPHIWTFYKMHQALLDSAIAYMMERMDIHGDDLLKGIAEDVERYRKTGSVLPKKDQSDTKAKEK